MWTNENIPDQTGKIIIVTSANIGLGFETALVLYEAAALIFIGVKEAFV